MTKYFGLSRLTLCFGLYIIISASFIQQAWNFIKHTFGRYASETFLLLLFCLVTLALLVYYIIRHRFSFPKLMLNVFFVFLAFLFTWRQQIFVEKMHVLEYGFLGWFAAKDLILNGNKLIKPVSRAILYVFIIGVSDEIFQKYLPYRVGEIKDVCVNLLSSFLGVALFITDRK